MAGVSLVNGHIDEPTMKEITAEEAIKNLHKAAEEFARLPEEVKKREIERFQMWQIGVTQNDR